ncbi:hypothetical protein GCK72_023133 [Caenorhabditis remanei]|uniref:Delta-like protein n=1 Tax=Caenorhabditis remanei TaxID=31234 RepID=A0A6A5FVT9_CAERE|nr:hypothetical protein GCK72_023133 [Caenorhabditis remanei]KAF1746676.1 hypothetical protein GCK72_023133 [Caenorhabditis remanei]
MILLSDSYSIVVGIFVLAIVHFTQAFGVIQFIVTSPEAIHLEVTACVQFECSSHDELSEIREIPAGGIPFHFHTGDYKGSARNRLDLHFRVVDPQTQEEIAMSSHNPELDTEWNKIPIIIETSRGFKIVAQLRNKCQKDYYGKLCDRLCLISPKSHWMCDKDGNRICEDGWGSLDCSRPECDSGCNQRGICVRPNECRCVRGFHGNQCETCIPTQGCVNGNCINNIPNTCECRKGFHGRFCELDDSAVCELQRPCENGGRCVNAPYSALGYTCDCSHDYTGSRCQTALSSMHCSRKDICKNNGVCETVGTKTIRCNCRDGYTGTFCEIKMLMDCFTAKCPANAECHMNGNVPVCVEVGIKPEITLPERAERVFSVDEALMKEKMHIVQETQNSKTTVETICVILLSIILIYFIYKYRENILTIIQTYRNLTHLDPLLVAYSSAQNRVQIGDQPQPEMSSDSSDNEDDHVSSSCEPSQGSSKRPCTPPPSYLSLDLPGTSYV